MEEKYVLYPPSKEQSNILHNISLGNNIKIQAVAGSGKTTTILHILNSNQDKNILCLMFNKKLQIETKEKAKSLNLLASDKKRGGIILTFHGSCSFHFSKIARNDKELKHIISTEQKTKDIVYDIIIVDECQDMNINHYLLITKLVSSQKIPQLVLCGDNAQMINAYMHSTTRFLDMCNNLFFTGKPWITCELFETYRLTIPMVNFLNDCVFGFNKLHSNKKSNIKVQYLHVNPYEEVVEHIFALLNQGFKPRDIYILAPSIRNIKLRNDGHNNPLAIIENKLSRRHILTYISKSDDEIINKEELMKDRIVFLSYNQSKGLENKVVFVFSFDESYIKFFNKSNSEGCSNEHYVALTRAKEILYVVHSDRELPLPFVDMDKVKEYTNFVHPLNPNNEENICVVSKELKLKIKYNCFDVSVLCRHLTPEVLNYVSSLFNIVKITKKTKKINLPLQITNIQYVQEGEERIEKQVIHDVCAINGVVVPLYYEFIRTNKCTILTTLLNNINIFLPIEVRNIIEKLKETIDMNNAKHLLELSNAWLSYLDGFISNLCIKNYSWVNIEKLNLCCNRLKLILKDEGEGKYEKQMKIDQIKGSIDFIGTNNIYEFKCVGELKIEHRIQLLLYYYIFQRNHMKEHSCLSNMGLRLYNILTDELECLEITYENSRKLYDRLIEFKNKSVSPCLGNCKKTKVNQNGEEYDYYGCDFGLLHYKCEERFKQFIIYEVNLMYVKSMNLEELKDVYLELVESEEIPSRSEMIREIMNGLMDEIIKLNIFKFYIF